MLLLIALAAFEMWRCIQKCTQDVCTYVCSCVLYVSNCVSTTARALTGPDVIISLKCFPNAPKNRSIFAQLSPNMVMLGFKRDWMRNSAECRQYVDILFAGFRHNLSIGILR